MNPSRAWLAALLSVAVAGCNCGGGNPNVGDGGSDGGAPGSDAGGSDGGLADSGADSGNPGTDGGCGPCNTPPDACHALQGTCQGGVCDYAFVEGASCDDGNPCTVGDTCTQGSCVGTPMVCDTPPANYCLSATQLETYTAQGTCNGGICVYSKSPITCADGGCVNNQCATDPCQTITCNMPPSVCYGATGTCSNGSCSYPYNDGASCDDGNACTTNDSCNAGSCQGVPIACTSPPANSCVNATTAKIYAPVGSCSAGTCSYSFGYYTCATGCSNGQCNASGWHVMTSNTNSQLDAVWGSSASDVWAVGVSGAAMHYDGVQWEARSAGTSDEIVAVSGTASDNVFAVTTGADGLPPQLLYFDGGSWASTATIPLAQYNEPGDCVYAYGPNDVFVGLSDYSGGAIIRLYRVTGGVVTQLAQTPFAELTGPCNLWAFSPSDVWVSGYPTAIWNGSAMTDAGIGGLGFTDGLWAASTQSVFAFNQNGQVADWNGSAWQILNTGQTSTLSWITGTSPSRVFTSGYYSTGQFTYAPQVLAYDGSGWTQASLPTDGGSFALYGIWAAPTGEVFAVGEHGIIFQGP